MRCALWPAMNPPPEMHIFFLFCWGTRVRSVPKYALLFFIPKQYCASMPTTLATWGAYVATFRFENSNVIEPLCRRHHAHVLPPPRTAAFIRRQGVKKAVGSFSASRRVTIWWLLGLVLLAGCNTRASPSLGGDSYFGLGWGRALLVYWRHLDGMCCGMTCAGLMHVQRPGDRASPLARRGSLLMHLRCGQGGSCPPHTLPYKRG